LLSVRFKEVTWLRLDIRWVRCRWEADRKWAALLRCRDRFVVARRRPCPWSSLRVSQWAELKAWHVFGNSSISALASKDVDQRIIDDLVGHWTEERRRRYRHLFPDVKQQALLGVFG